MYAPRSCNSCALELAQSSLSWSASLKWTPLTYMIEFPYLQKDIARYVSGIGLEVDVIHPNTTAAIQWQGCTELQQKLVFNLKPICVLLTSPVVQNAHHVFLVLGKAYCAAKQIAYRWYRG
jgi:hypothetical protein